MVHRRVEGSHKAHRTGARRPLGHFLAFPGTRACEVVVFRSTLLGNSSNKSKDVITRACRCAHEQEEDESVTTHLVLRRRRR